MFPDRSEPEQDRALAEALGRSNNITIAYLPRTGAQEGKFEDVRPLQQFRDKAGVGTIAVRYNYANEAWHMPLGVERGNAIIPSLATVLAERFSGRSSEFRINYAFDPASIQEISAADVLSGRSKDALKGKTVVVGLAAERLGDQFMLPGWGKGSGVYIHIIAAETLKAGHPVDLGWFPA
jgi:CHASE2 domain-containing sensor protein